MLLTLISVFFFIPTATATAGSGGGGGGNVKESERNYPITELEGIYRDRRPLPSLNLKTKLYKAVVVEVYRSTKVRVKIIDNNNNNNNNNNNKDIVWLIIDDDMGKKKYKKNNWNGIVELVIEGTTKDIS
ncbi:hypothetical protein H8356DRAFT_1353162 [Neocallimastix lanati (nom. inval.)]|nr:hypothetical protein H8356DRAFT_1353162 [Neocallimastix sp. JGI-2020a]